MELFAAQTEAAMRAAQPLAVRMRPASLDEFVGQEEIIGPGRLLRRLLEADRLSSAILYGPPGTGKTALAHLVARHTKAHFDTLHAASAGVKEVRALSEAARDRLASSGRRTVLFLDEIHRFSRTQQDSLLKDVEEGVLILIGATTENPFFAVNSPLISRSNVFQFQPLTAEDILALLRRALADPRRGLGQIDVKVDEEALRYIADKSEGDARRALNALEVAVVSQTEGGAPRLEPGNSRTPHVTVEVAADSMQRKLLQHDRTGDAHYDVASAFIKSMRGSDPDAALYWMARMMEAGEDPRFIARRMAVAASEDVGNADPRAMVIAAAAVQITELVGWPECQYALAQAAVYIACSPKSNAVKRAIGAALEDVREKHTLPVPLHLRDASYPGAARLGHGKGYLYPHDFPDGIVAQDYLGAPKVYYNPTSHGEEKRLAAYLERVRRLRQPDSSPDAPSSP